MCLSLKNAEDVTKATEELNQLYTEKIQKLQNELQTLKSKSKKAKSATLKPFEVSKD